MHRESAETRAIYKVLFSGWRDRLLDLSNWPGLEAQDRESYVNILGAWLCEFDSKETHSPFQLSPTHWFPMSLVQLLGYDSGLRTWMMSDSTARSNPAYNYVSSDGTDPSQRKCRLSSLNELARNDPASPLQHFGYSANHYYPIPIPTVERTDLEQAWRAIMVTASDILRGCHAAGMSSAPRDERMNVARHAAAPWEPRTILPLPSAFCRPPSAPPPAPALAAKACADCRRHFFVPLNPHHARCSECQSKARKADRAGRKLDARSVANAAASAAAAS
jgi:hypothetical protein